MLIGFFLILYRLLAVGLRAVHKLDTFSCGADITCYTYRIVSYLYTHKRLTEVDARWSHTTMSRYLDRSATTANSLHEEVD